MGSSLTREREKKSFFSCSSEKKINKKVKEKGRKGVTGFGITKSIFCHCLSE